MMCGGDDDGGISASKNFAHWLERVDLSPPAFWKIQFFPLFADGILLNHDSYYDRLVDNQTLSYTYCFTICLSLLAGCGIECDEIRFSNDVAGLLPPTFNQHESALHQMDFNIWDVKVKGSATSVWGRDIWYDLSSIVLTIFSSENDFFQNMSPNKEKRRWSTNPRNRCWNDPEINVTSQIFF